VKEVDKEDVNALSTTQTSLEKALINVVDYLTSEEEKDLRVCLEDLDHEENIFAGGTNFAELTNDGPSEKTKVKLKILPNHLMYVFLEENETETIVISGELTAKEENKLVEVLKRHREAIGWHISDLKGISTAYCMHKIMMEEDYRPVKQPQRRLNLSMKEEVRKEVLKILEVGLIYPISNNAWVSPVQVVPKKGGLIFIQSAKNDLIPRRTVIGWRICIDYRKLKEAIRKNHFLLSFMNQMLERLTGHAYYCFLDGYS